MVGVGEYLIGQVHRLPLTSVTTLHDTEHALSLLLFLFGYSHFSGLYLWCCVSQNMIPESSETPEETLCCSKHHFFLEKNLPYLNPSSNSHLCLYLSTASHSSNGFCS